MDSYLMLFVSCIGTSIGPCYFFGNCLRCLVMKNMSVTFMKIIFVYSIGNSIIFWSFSDIFSSYLIIFLSSVQNYWKISSYSYGNAYIIHTMLPHIILFCLSISSRTIIDHLHKLTMAVDHLSILDITKIQ